jgi:hypothetical protein
MYRSSLNPSPVHSIYRKPHANQSDGRRMLRSRAAGEIGEETTDEISEVAATLAQQYLAVTARSSFEIDARFAYQGDVWSSVEDMQQVYGTQYLRYNDKPVVRQLFIDEEKTGCCSGTPCGRCARLAVY